MTEKDFSQYGIGTRGVRAGQRRTHEGEQSEPIFTTSSFVFDSAEQAAARFSGEEPGNIYSRFTNPTVNTFERRLAALEGGERCVATASGMAAITAACSALLKSGDHILSSNGIFGSTTILFNKYLSRFGIEHHSIPLTDLTQWEASIKSNTRMLFIETPSNPLAEVVDIKALAEIAKRHDCLLVVDNTVCTAVLQRPLELGADLVVVSATKYIDGQGRCVGGAVIGNGELIEDVYGFLRTAGPSMSPFNAWVFMKGLETLKVRMQAHSASALILAKWLETHLAVKQVFYAGLESHLQHKLAAQQQDGFSGLLAFELKGGRDEAWRFINGTALVSITANLGDAKTTITHPATTTHGRLSDEERDIAGIHQGLVRVAVGLEDVEDLQADLQRGFDAL
ncbi:O-acetylhomoserine sulfhydrylase / O-succinylhomoserine sulfhydrylase [hydrothermal vent metagenome]|uniref:O-acetylhomoserine sulfhydrylase / O-succinylhomoserine sulfhydrylase n=1 Tax=hydrothermal vent metagenome TaxID=652676 RepID=A0A3B0Z4X3_9ZZZZ